MTTPCFICRGPYHPATGWAFVPFDVVYCGPCAQQAAAFYRRTMARTVGKTAGFYEAAATSVRAGRLHDAARSSYLSTERT